MATLKDKERMLALRSGACAFCDDGNQSAFIKERLTLLFLSLFCAKGDLSVLCYTLLASIVLFLNKIK